MRILILLLFSILLITSCSETKNESVSKLEWPDSIYFEYYDLKGIGKEEGITRRDPSDVIMVNDTFYVYYTKVINEPSGYWGTIWAAKSTDGENWIEIGEVLGLGPEGTFDSHATFTPNILKHNNTYYLYYTAVKPTPGTDDFENNSVNDFTAIGVAKSDTPEGPFERTGTPLISVSSDSSSFDSYRVDDAALAVKGDSIFLYHKGRSIIHGPKGPLFTKTGVAISDNPEGSFKKYPGYILDKSHEVLIWKRGIGIATLASFSSTIEYAKDWIDFTSDSLGYKVVNRPTAPGLYRKDLTNPKINEIPEWGVCLEHRTKSPYLKGFRIIRVNE